MIGAQIALADSGCVSPAEVWRALIKRAASGVFGSSSDIVERRRAVDAMYASLLPRPVEVRVTGPRTELALRLGIADARRNGWSRLLDDHAVRAPSEQVSDRPWLWDESEAPAALQSAFHDAFNQVFDIAGSDGWRGAPLSADLTEDGHHLRRTTDAGWREIVEGAPELIDALVAHVNCLAWVDIRSAETKFRSGTSPLLPGVVLLAGDEAGTESYMAEAFVHEAAHCKFFDLCSAREVVGAESETHLAFRLEIPWVTGTQQRAREWPLDQVLAASHAYLHVALLAGQLSTADATRSTHWIDVRTQSTERALFLLDGVGQAPLAGLGADGIAFVRWMRAGAQLAAAIATLLRRWENDGPTARLEGGVKRAVFRGWPDGLIGVSETQDAIWASASALELVAPEGARLGDLAATRSRAHDQPLADSLVQIVDELLPLIDIGVAKLDYAGS